MSNLTIVDLHKEEELSTSSVGKIAGGTCAPEAASVAVTAEGIWNDMGFSRAAGIMQGTVIGMLGTCDLSGEEPE